MSFIEEIKELANDRNNKEDLVINEIIDYFKEKMYSKKFEENLKELYIKKAINQGKNNCDLWIEFWEYCSGCSYTNIYVGGCGKFELKGEDNNYKSYYDYKGIRLCDIHKKVCNRLSTLLKNRLEELGLKVSSSERLDNNYRFNYYKEKIKISWYW